MMDEIKLDETKVEKLLKAIDAARDFTACRYARREDGKVVPVCVIGQLCAIEGIDLSKIDVDSRTPVKKEDGLRYDNNGSIINHVLGRDLMASGWMKEQINVILTHLQTLWDISGGSFSEWKAREVMRAYVKGKAR